MKNSTRGKIPSFLILESFREAKILERQGRDMIHLSLGQPGVEAPAQLREKVATYISSKPLGYTESPGYLPLRERIGQHYAEEYNITDIPVDRIFVTVGSSAAFLMSLIAAFDAGDKIAIALPCYPAYPNMMRALNIEPIFLRTDKQHKFQPTVEMLQNLPSKPQGLVIASPSNPAGTILSATEMERLCQYCDAENIRILSDEIYHGISYGQNTASVAQFSSKAIVINSFSKYYLLPGWRVGWTVMADDLLDSFNAISANFFISASAIGQYAALAAFDYKKQLNAVVRNYARNREIMLQELPKAGFSDLSPVEGAFYVYANISDISDNSSKFCHKMMHDTGVVAVPGIDFDQQHGHEYVRFSFSATTERIIEATKRIRQWTAG